MPYQILTLVNGSLEQNCYALRVEGRAECVLIDPGSSPLDLRSGLDSAGARPVLMLATHGHFDHVGAAQDLADAYRCPFGLSRLDEALLDTLEDSYAFYGLGATRRPNVDRWLDPSTRIDEAGIRLQVLATPGHTPGGLCFWHADSRSLFSGDSLFAGSVGRSDFEGSSHEQLIAGIRRELFSLPDPDSITVYPGHGEATRLGEEIRHNPFLR
jgi:glyoxylase-like metal-dependent hydrolase (beta-lactamase superfamily II)